jgi:hypothetical protein
MSDVTIDNHDKNDDDVLGCEIRKGDTQKIIASLACYSSFIVYGSSAGTINHYYITFPFITIIKNSFARFSFA